MNRKIENITWTVSGKIDKITRTNGSTKPDLEFAYDAQGNRIRKIVKPSGSLSTPTLWTTTDYVRDPQGNVLAVYNGQFVSSAHDYKLKEGYLYGSSLVGMDLHEEDMYVTTAGIPLQNGDPALKQFQLSNHLGNVLAVVNGERKAIPDVTGNSIDHFEAQLENSSDYYPFGSLLRERSTRWVWIKGLNFSTNPADVFLALVNMNEDPANIAIDGKSYRFGFNGKENDNEVKGSGNSLDFGARIYDSRLGRWLSLDPLQMKYPSLSPYNFVANNPINFIDPDGKRIYAINKQAREAVHQLLQSFGKGSQIGDIFNISASREGGYFSTNDAFELSENDFNKRISKSKIKLSKEERANAYKVYLALYTEEDIQIEIVERSEPGTVRTPGVEGTKVVGSSDEINENEGLNQMKNDITKADGATKEIIDEAVRPEGGAGTGKYKPDQIGDDYAIYHGENSSQERKVRKTILIDGSKKSASENAETLKKAIVSE
ncbi:MAG: RHS repeat domain-containing protein [Bacteroidia bacterium]